MLVRNNPVIYVFVAWLFAIVWLNPLHSISIDEGINTLRLRQNGLHFADCIFKFISLSADSCIFIQISLIFVPRD